MGLRPLDLIWLAFAGGIVVDQIVARHGQFDPIALAAIAFFVGMIPAARADRSRQNGAKANGGKASEEKETLDPASVVRRIIQGYLDDTEGKKK